MERREPNFPAISPAGLGLREGAKWVVVGILAGTISGLLVTGIWTVWGHDVAQSLRASHVVTTAAAKSDCR